ncbi:aspartate aminotransferase [Trichocoleus sp. FACHB-6]|nr:aspartate aminotransferase [Trichocoleus sp. FACHB-832]MBD2063888.1 aspartate aminotransferase [Trichocoleus sp. FACHB-6]
MTRVYQEPLEEGRQEGFEQGQLQAKLEIMLRLLQKGLSMEQVPEILELDVETVRQSAQEQP